MSEKMSNNQEAILFVLKRVTSLVSKLSDDDLKDLLDGKISIGLLGKENNKKRDKEIVDEKSIQEYVSQLRTSDEREKGTDLLNKKNITKSFLKRLAKQIDIPVSHRDNVEILKEKIIEATIGYRLRSKAIQNNI